MILNSIRPQSPKSLIGSILLLVIPLLLFLNTLNYLNKCGPRSVLNYDPEYIYLYSGVSLGRLHLNVGHIDNPGTPLQVLYAVVTRATHLFSGEGDYYSDVLLRSDHYLRQVDMAKMILICSLLYIFGLLFLNVSSSIIAALFLQLSPFFDINTLQLYGRTVPECLAIIPVLFLFYLILRFLASNQKNLSNREVWFFALVGAFGLSVKLDYVPLVLIPVFIVGSWRNIGLYFLRLSGAFFIFAFPILFDLNFFFRWVRGLLTHSGNYGTGEANFIDWAKFVINLGSLYDLYPVYIWITAFLFIITPIIWLIKSLSKKHKLILSGLALSALVHILLVAKHFSPHYIMPGIFLFPLVLYLLIYSVKKYAWLKQAILAGLILFFVFSSLRKFNSYMKWKVPQQTNKREMVAEVRSITGDSPFLIIPYPYNANFEESGLLFGWFFAGKMRDSSSDLLTEKLPDRYVYDNINDAFFLWKAHIQITEIPERHNEFYVFINRGVQEKHWDVIERLGINRKLECVYENQQLGDKLYLISSEE